MVETIDKDRETLYNAAMSEQQSETRTIPNQELAEVTTTIVEHLGETEPAPISQIRRAVKVLGTDQALTLLNETLSIETQGGLMLPDQSRRRTPGGVFFHLIRTTIPKKVRGRIFLPPQQKKPDAAQSAPSSTKAPRAAPTPASVQPAFNWADRIAVIEEIGNEKGIATTVKMTLIGRPGKVVDRGTCVVTSMQTNKVPSLPKGLPIPSTAQTTYTVYIANKQWKKVADAIADPEDALIVEGFPQLDDKTGSIAVFVSNATTKKLQQAQRQPQTSESPS